MSGRIDIERSLDQFLAEGPETVADRALQHALDEIDRTPQRRDLFARWRFLTVTPYPRLAAAAIVAVVVVGGALFVLSPRSGVGPPATTPNPTVAPTTAVVAPTAAVVAPTAAAVKPSPTPGPATPTPTLNLDTATWTPYPVSRYGYSLT